MYLIDTKCENKSSMIDYMLKRNMMNDYVYNNTFIEFTFSDDLYVETFDTFVGYMYRLLWETVFIKNTKRSTHAVQTDVQQEVVWYNIKCNLSEVLQFLETTVPPVLKKGRPVIEQLNDMNDVIETCQTLLLDPRTKMTNISYFRKIMHMQSFDWQSSYPVKRALLIRGCLKNSDPSEPDLMTKVISDLMVDGTSSDEDTVVTFTFDSDNYLEFLGITDSDIVPEGLIITDLFVTSENTSVTTVVNKERIHEKLYNHIRNTYAALTAK